eukprot:symbB.v1.2.033146.t1/scaffold4078.1/size45081/2
MATAAVPLAQIENCVKRRELSEAETALRQNISQKGENAYYFAHNRHFEIPEDAKIISGPGLVTGGSPEKIQDGGAALIKEERIDDLLKRIQDYAWADAGSKVKVYIDVELPANASEETASATFDTRSFVLDIAGQPWRWVDGYCLNRCQRPAWGPGPRKLKVDKLSADIKADESKVRVEAAKGRVTVVLAKKRDSIWRSLVLQK